MAPHEPSTAVMQQSAETRTLEMAYEKACRQVDLVCESEKARQLRMQTLLLEDENDDLHTQLAQGNERIDELERYTQDLQEDAKAVAGTLEAVQGDLRIKSREIETLKAELDSLHGVTMDSTKLLTEKLTLTRELSSLRPELDHLRSQAASHQSLLAEKLALQRQLSTLQVELENEKRSTQRLAAREGKTHVDDSKLDARMETAQAELAKERRERQMVDREARKASTVLENKILTLESRLDAFRGKLKITKESLKETQSELQKAQAADVRASAAGVSSAPTARQPRKRGASEMDADTMIGTPGDLPAAKKSRAKSTLPGEKSAFSITPFLNRTASIAPESPDREEEGSNDEMTAQDAPQSPSRPSKVKAPSKPMRIETTEKPKSQDEGEGDKKTTSLGNERSKKVTSRPSVRKAMAAPRLEQVAEEEGVLPAVSTELPPKATASKSVPDETLIDEPGKKKVKRKLLGGGLGKTLFDEDDGDPLKGDRRILGGVRGFGTQGRGALGGPKLGAGAAGGFGAFSPLKRDRKGSAAQRR